MMLYSLVVAAFFTFFHMASFVSTNDRCLRVWANAVKTGHTDLNYLLYSLLKTCNPTIKPLENVKLDSDKQPEYEKVIANLVKSMAEQFGLELKHLKYTFESFNVRKVIHYGSSGQKLWCYVIGYIYYQSDDLRENNKKKFSLAVIRGTEENTYLLATSYADEGAWFNNVWAIADAVVDNSNQFTFHTSVKDTATSAKDTASSEEDIASSSAKETASSAKDTSAEDIATPAKDVRLRKTWYIRNDSSKIKESFNTK